MIRRTAKLRFAIVRGFSSLITRATTLVFLNSLFSLQRWVYSLMVERVAHNDVVVGSTPAKPKAARYRDI